MERETCFAFSDETIDVLTILATDGIPALADQGLSWTTIGFAAGLSLLIVIQGLRTALQILRDYY